MCGRSNLARLLTWIVCAMATPAVHADATAPATAAAFSAARAPVSAAVSSSTALADSLGPNFRVRPRARPEWWREYSDGELAFEQPVLERDSLHLVLQEDRPDGPDMLTLRYPFMALGAFEIYAGAGLGQVVYLAKNGVGPILLFGRAERHRSVRPAAELGSELRFGEAAFVGIDLRWLDLDDDASLLRTEDGMIDASPWATRVTVGWRFR